MKAAICFAWCLAVLFFGTSAAFATKPVPFDLRFHFPQQGMPIGTKATIAVDTNTTWSSIRIMMHVKRADNGFPASNFDFVKVQQQTKLTTPGGGTVAIPIQVIGDGEYEIDVEVYPVSGEGESTGRESFRSLTISILSEHGVVWFGEGDIRDAYYERIKYSVEKDNSISAYQKESAIRDQYTKEIDSQREKARIFNQDEHDKHTKEIDLLKKKEQQQELKQ